MEWVNERSSNIEPRWCYFRTACPKRQGDTCFFHAT